MYKEIKKIVEELDVKFIDIYEIFNKDSNVINFFPFEMDKSHYHYNSTGYKKIAETILLQRLHGIKGDSWDRCQKDNEWYYEVVDIGYKYNITDIQSSMGLIQLEKLEHMRGERKKIAEQYMNAFSGQIEYIKEINYTESSWHLFVIKVSNRDELHHKLKEAGVGTSVHFIPIHKHPYYKDIFSYNNSDYPIANTVYETCLSLPIYPGLCDVDVQYVIKLVLQYYNSIVV